MTLELIAESRNSCSVEAHAVTTKALGVFSIHLVFAAGLPNPARHHEADDESMDGLELRRTSSQLADLPVTPTTRRRQKSEPELSSRHSARGRLPGRAKGAARPPRLHRPPRTTRTTRVSSRHRISKNTKRIRQACQVAIQRVLAAVAFEDQTNQPCFGVPFHTQKGSSSNVCTT